MADAIPQEKDPYEPRPSFVKEHAHEVAAAVVFVLTAGMTVLAFPPARTPEFAYTMLVPGVFWAYRRPSFKLYAATLLASQVVAWTILLGWLHHVTWLGLFLLGPFVGLWVGSWFLAVRWAMPRMIGQPVSTRLLVMIGVAAAWVVIEWTRTWLLGGFPWLPLAASQWTMLSMLQVASYTGAGGISFAVVMVNLGIAAYAHRLMLEKVTGLNKRSQEFLLALFTVLACFSLHVQQTFNRVHYAAPLARVAFVQPYIPQEVKWDPSRSPAILDALETTTLAAAATRPDLIVWPEAGTPWAVRGDDTMKEFVESLARRAQAPLLLGSIAREGAGGEAAAWFNGAFVVDAERGLQADYYSKRHLVPFGEYVPLRPILGWIEKFVPVGGDFTPGAEALPLTVATRHGTIRVAPLICYEDIYPGLARRSTLEDADVLVVQTNNGWFGEGGAATQHAAHSVLRAVENRRPVLRCGNGGWSGWIDEFGAIRATVKDEKGSIYFRGTQTVSITRDTRWIGKMSFYSEYGEWFVLLCAGLAGFAVALLKVGGAPAEPAGKSPGTAT